MKITKFMQDGTNVRIIAFNKDMVTDTLAPAVYVLCYCKFTGFYLSTHSERFDVPKTVYGSTNRRAEKVINTYLERTVSTGILLSGDKGSGKTMTSALVANRMIDMNLPVILIEEAYAGSAFNDFINSIGECCLFFDEFGKMYKRNDNSDQESQTSLLTLFDGTGSKRRLIMLTENDTYNINEFMLDRPGRIYYHFRHDKLDQELIVEYCTAKGVPKGVINEVLMRCDTSWSFSFDVLQAIVEEWSRYGGSIKDIAADLNIEQPIAQNQQMEIKSIVDTKTEETYDVAKNYKIVKFPSDDSEYIRWETSRDEDGSMNHNDTYFSVRELVARTDNKVVFECMEDNVIITAEILPMRTTAYNRAAF